MSYKNYELHKLCLSKGNNSFCPHIWITWIKASQNLSVLLSLVLSIIYISSKSKNWKKLKMKKKKYIYINKNKNKRYIVSFKSLVSLQWFMFEWLLHFCSSSVVTLQHWKWILRDTKYILSLWIVLHCLRYLAFRCTLNVL